MLNKLFLSFLTLIIATSLPVTSQAQDRDPFAVKDSFYFMQDDGEFSDEEKDEEAEYIHGLCQKNHFQRTYYDCECIAGAYRVKRDKGDLMPQAMLLNNVFDSDGKKCTNTASIAGDAFKFCSDHVFYSRPRVKPEENEKYCECVANQTALNFKKSPSISLSNLKRLRSEALLSCDLKDQS